MTAERRNRAKGLGDRQGEVSTYLPTYLPTYLYQI